MYLLMEGWIKVLRPDADGREVILDILGSGEVFGTECVLGEDPYETTVETVEDSLIGRIAKVDFVRFLSRHEHLAIGLARHLSDQIRKMRRHIADLVFNTVPGRLARLLLTYYYTTPGVTDCLSGCVRLTHQEMANLIGCSRETISTVIGQFMRVGLVRYDSRVITGLDEKGLSRLLKALPDSDAAHPTSRWSIRPSTGRLPMRVSAGAHRVSLQADPACLHGRAAQ